MLHFTFTNQSAISPFLAGLPHSPRLSLPPLACAPMTISRQNIIVQFISCLPYFLHLHWILYWLFALLVLLSLSPCLSLSLALLLPGLRGRSKPPGHQGPPAFDGLLEGSEGSTMLGPKWQELRVLLLCCFGLSSCFRTFEFSLALARSRSRSLFCDGKHNGKKASLVTPMRTPCFFKCKGTSLTHGFGRMESTIGPLG